MKIWDEVRLSSEWKDKYMDTVYNPHNLIWIIHSFGVWWTIVEWSNWENNNYYFDFELELVDDSSKSETLTNFKIWDRVKYKDWKAIYTITQIDWDNIKTFYKGCFYIIKAHKLELYNKETEELNWLPKYWIVKKDTSNPLWIKFIDYIRKTYSYNVGNAYDYYWYDWSPIWLNGFNCFDDRWHFKNDPTLITLEQLVAVVSKSDEIKKLTLEQPIKPTDNLWTIKTDYHWNFLHTNLWTMKVINKLNDIRSEKFFSNEKNLTAIETLNDTLESWVKLIEDSIKELMDSKDKFEKLIHKLDSASNESDVSLLKSMIAQIDEVKFFVKQLEETKIEKYKQANESVFSIKDFLSSKK